MHVILPAFTAQLTHLQHFVFTIGIILILDAVIYRTCLAVCTQIYGRAEARRLAYGTGWTFAIIAKLIAYWWFFG